METAKAGKTNDDFVLNVDVAPTILAALGFKKPANMQGRNFAPLYLGGDQKPWRTEFFYEHATLRNANFIPASEALVRKDFKYFFWPEHHVEQLFDIVADPREENDLSKNSEYEKKLVEMRQRFKERKQQAK